MDFSLSYEQAQKITSLLRVMGNRHRLLILCLLHIHGAMSMGDLLQHLPLNQSTLSQHLFKMRTEGLIISSREAQSAQHVYAICHSEKEAIIQLCEAIFSTSF